MSYKILSLDGGGTWAILETMALKQIYGGDTSGHAILANFDLTVANSGGSIVLAGLVLDKSPNQILQIFTDQASREAIFYKKPFLEEALSQLPIFPKYVAAQKRTGLSAGFGPAGDKMLSDWPAAAGWPNGPSGKPVGLLIMAFDYDVLREELLRSYAVPSTGATAEAIPLVDAVHASTNAPVTYFDAPTQFSNRRYWDGAMGGYNNPLMAGVVDAIALGVAPSEIAALSLGTGTVRLAPPHSAQHDTPPALVAPISQPSALGDAGRAAGVITDDPPDAATYTAHIVTMNPPGACGRVVRLSPVVQPVKDAAGAWAYPAGLPSPLFENLSKLHMDAVQAADVQNIISLGQAWIADQANNQAIRMGDDLSCRLGHSTFSAGVAQWMTL